MNQHPLSDIVSNQYSRWTYPQPILDLPGWLKNNWQWFDPSHANRLFWPQRDDRTNLDILVAGCGTNQAAVIAFNNPEARVTAVDVSQQSLAHHQFLKDKYQLNNLSLNLLPIEQIGRMNLDFDLIISTGVLHHLASPEVGIQALSQCLRVDGVMALMLYAKYGRLGVDMLQSVFREMGMGQTETSVLMVKEALATLPQDHPVNSYIAIAPDLGYDAGLVDTFLHGRDRNYSTADCLALVASAGLVFQDLFFKSPYFPPPNSTNPFHAAVSTLKKEQQWAIMEQINFNNGCHFFTACRTDRPTAGYRIDFDNEQALDYTPMLRYRCGFDGQSLSRYDWTMNLDAQQQAAVALVDGQRTLRQILKTLNASGAKHSNHSPMTTNLLLRQFNMYWQLDFMAMGL